MFSKFKIFDSHLHIIDKQYPLISNNRYIPNEFTVQDYLTRMSSYELLGGTIVSGSFQAFDQNYLIKALELLGPSFVGVTQLSSNTSDEEIIRLNSYGIRAIRFNLKRGGSEEITHLVSMAERVYEIAGWHVELYVDSSELAELYKTLIKLPSVSIDHLGLSKSGLKYLLELVSSGVKVKATGFGRVDFDVRNVLSEIYNTNPAALMFGTDLPSTRANRPYFDNDFLIIEEVLGADAAVNVFSKNALSLYKPKSC